MNILPNATKALLAGALLVALAGCSSPQDKVAGFNKRGESLLQKGEIAKARLEFQNALQIDGKSVPALVGLADIAERNREWTRAYAILGQVVDLDPRHVPARVKLGKLLLAAGQFDKALEMSDASFALQPQDPGVLAFRAAVFFKLQDTRTAIELANQAIEKDRHHVDAHIVLASERLQAGDPAAAVAFLDRSLAGNERNVAVQLIKVQALSRLSRIDSAEDVFRRLIALFPENTAYRSMLSKFYLAHGKTDQAEAEQRAILAATPSSTEAKLELVRFLAAVRGRATAGTELEKMIAAQPSDHGLKLALAHLRVEQGKPAEAQALWKSVIADAGSDAAGTRARGALASYFTSRGDKASARLLIDEILARDARNEQGLLLRASVAIDDRRLDEAVADLRTILRDVPDSAAAQLLLARSHELQGLPELAQSHFAKAAQVAKFDPQFGMPYAEYLVKIGRARQAEGVLRDVLKATPGHPAAQRLLAQTYLRLGDLAAAQGVADEAARTDKGAITANQIKGAVQAARRDFDSSIASFRRAYELSPSEVQPMAALVRTYIAAGKTRQAVSFMQSVVAASPGNAAAHLLLGQVFLQTGDRASARGAFEQVAKLEPANPGAYQGMASAHIAERKLEAALAALDAGLKALPDHFGLRLARAGVLESMNRPEEAIASYETLLKERPNAVVVANNLASLLADHRADDKSLRRAHDLAQRFRGSDVPYFKDTLAWTSHRMGKVKEASDLLKSVVGEIPEVAAVHYHHGMNQLALNNRDGARKSLQKAIELAKNSHFPQADEARRTLQGL